jgi:hypothetical protein
MITYVYAMDRERVSKKSLDTRSDFDEWANQVVAALKTHRLHFGESAGQASPAQNPTGLSRWASRMLGS